jgi:predicted ABC-type ATPase
MTEIRPTLCVVAGPNGSGKTTTTTQLLENEWTADSLYITSFAYFTSAHQILPSM